MSSWKLPFFVVVLFVLLMNESFAQKRDSSLMMGIIHNGDTIIHKI
jgi:hypothetical protein